MKGFDKFLRRNKSKNTNDYFRASIVDFLKGQTKTWTCLCFLQKSQAILSRSCSLGQELIPKKLNGFDLGLLAICTWRNVAPTVAFNTVRFYLLSVISSDDFRCGVVNLQTW